MKSIEKQLLTRILVGQNFVWLIAGISVWYSQRARLFSEFDNELKFISAALRFHINSGRVNEEVKNRWPQFLEPQSGWYFQAWNHQGEIGTSSPNLLAENKVLEVDNLMIPEPEGETNSLNKYRIIECTGPEGTPLRGFLVKPRNIPWRSRERFTPENETERLVVVRSREALNHRLVILAIVAMIFGTLASVTTALLIRTSIRKGMLPLRRMGTDAEEIDISSLEKRFDENGLPAELVPISQCLNDLIERLEQGFIRERRFNSDLAHELRTPLAEIRSLADYLVKWPEESPSKHHAEILESAIRVEETIETLFKLTRWEAGLGTLEKEEIRIAPLLKDCWEHWREKAEEQGITLNLTVPEGLKTEADPRILRVIFNNLISNSVEYSQPDSGVTIRAEKGPHSYLVFSNPVTDITPETSERMVEPFWRSDSSRTGDSHCGLGLSIVHSCCKRIGWEVKSEISEDLATISIRLLMKNTFWN